MASGYREQVSRTIGLLKEGGEKMTVGQYKSVVMVLGNTGSGKTTLTEFLGGDNSQLISEEIESSGDYVITDKNEKISNIKSTIVSKTSVPELVVDRATRTAYYDCPGFSDTRDMPVDISSAYFVHKLVSRVDSVKLVFTVNYHAVRQGVDRRGFVTLLRHVAAFLRDVDKYADSMALVVTKVDNQIVRRNGKFVLVPDDNVIQGIARFLENAKSLMLSDLDAQTASTRKFRESAVKLIDIFLRRDGQGYSRIGIFRRPDAPGPLSEIPSMQEARRALVEIVSGNLRFSPVDERHFGYAISDESRNSINDVIESINDGVSVSLSGVARDVERHYRAREERRDEIGELVRLFDEGRDELARSLKTASDSATPKQFLIKVLCHARKLDAEVSASSLLEVMRQDEYLGFLQLVSQKKPSSGLLRWIKSVEPLVDYVNGSRNWYLFLRELHALLSRYEVQRDAGRYNSTRLMETVRSRAKLPDQPTGSALDEFLGPIYSSAADGASGPRNDIRDVPLDAPKVRTLARVLRSTLENDLTARFPDPRRLVVTGTFVKLTDVTRLMSSRAHLESVEIHAAEKVFVDADIVAVGRKLRLAILAPTWEVVGARRISLDGEHATRDPELASRAGTSPDGPGQHGAHGKPGAAGGAAGSFLGVGREFANGPGLTITANGGNGAPGQDGGDGGDGADGADADPRTGAAKSHAVYDGWRVVLLIYNSFVDNYVLEGGDGYRGGDGGDGGAGGLPGARGQVVMCELEGSSGVRVRNLDGLPGVDGAGGVPGTGGYDGATCDVEKARSNLIGFIPLKTAVISRECNRRGGRAASGKRGSRGAAIAGRSQPEPPVVVEKPAGLVNEYKGFLRRTLSGRATRHGVERTLERLDESDAVRRLYDTYAFVGEYETLDGQYRELGDELDFEPFYRSLARRVDDYRSRPGDGEDRPEFGRALDYLYTACLSKLFQLREDLDNNMVIYVKDYLDLVIANVEKLRDASRRINVDDYNRGYEATVKSKIAVASAFIDKHVAKEIEEVGKRMSRALEIMGEDAAGEQEAAAARVNELIGRRKEEGERDILSRMMNIARNVAKFVDILMAFVPICTSIVDAINESADPASFLQLTQQCIEDLKGNTSIVGNGADDDSRGQEPVTGANGDASVDDAVQKLQRKSDLLKRYQRNISAVMIPALEALKREARDAAKNLEERSRVFANVAGWKVQSSIRSLKSQVRQLVPYAESTEELSRFLDRLDDAMDILIAVYDRIHTYRDQTTLAGYIAEVNSADRSGAGTGNAELARAVDGLELTIRSNLILGQYERAVNGLKHSVFPFAHFYLAEFATPEIAEARNDTRDMVERVVRHVEGLRARLVESEVSILKHDQYIHHERFDRENEHAGPFFAWRGAEHGRVVEDLLSGRKVVLKADVTRSSDKNAIKFNRIGVSLRATGGASQGELDEALKDFSVSMTHHGNSHYRCGNRFYTIASDSQTIGYSFKRDGQGEPAIRNKVYDKLKEADCMLSPYATWTVRLSNVSASFDALQRYVGRVDLELEGSGQYVVGDADFCDERFDRYYTADYTISESNDILYRLLFEDANSEPVVDFVANPSIDVAPIDLPVDYDDRDVAEAAPLVSSGASSSRDSFVNGAINSLAGLLLSIKLANPFERIGRWFANEGVEPLLAPAERTFDRFSTRPMGITGDYSFDVNGTIALANVLVRKYVTGQSYKSLLYDDSVRYPRTRERVEYAQNLAYGYYRREGGDRGMMDDDQIETKYSLVHDSCRITPVGYDAHFGKDCIGQPAKYFDRIGFTQ